MNENKSHPDSVTLARVPATDRGPAIQTERAMADGHDDLAEGVVAAAEITRLKTELAEARATNRDLHRRAQEAESRAYKQAGRMQRKVNKTWRWYHTAVDISRDDAERARKAESALAEMQNQQTLARDDRVVHELRAGELLAQRDAARAQNEHLRAALRNQSFATPSDRPDAMTPLIKAAAHDHDRYWTVYPAALDAVSNRHSKGALSHLVTYLMLEIDRLKHMVLQVTNWTPTHFHVKRGTKYRECARGKLQTDVPLSDYAELVAYNDMQGNWWFRSPSEFDDGRFIALGRAE
ncbi:hypothetical protein ACEUZ9_005483 [Paracoccus litorisediminis]|uniref:hypothetical protein n=1 Tax=Paracoccus litorisediminis TaxID=2006130 RepID=UPI00372E3014